MCVDVPASDNAVNSRSTELVTGNVSYWETYKCKQPLHFITPEVLFLFIKKKATFSKKEML